MQPSSNQSTSICSSTVALTRAGSDILALPFDLARESYARAVRAGLIERSMLQSARFARTLLALENFTLGIWARKL